MKRIIVAGLMAASSFVGLGALVAPAAHADVCVTYNINSPVYSSGGDQTTCVPTTLPGQ